MIVGFCGSGSMAAAMARGWAGDVDGMLFTDSGSGRATELAREVGGEALETNRELAERADLIVLAVKPAGLEEAAAGLQRAPAVISLLGATSLQSIEAAFPEAEVCRVMPNVAVEARRGVLCLAGVLSADARRKLELLGRVVEVPDADFDAATAVMGCSPAYFALLADAIAEAGAEAGLDPELAASLSGDAMAGTAELLRENDAAEVRQAVASPGGSTEAGLEALDRAELRNTVHSAVRASLARMRGEG